MDNSQQLQAAYRLMAMLFLYPSPTRLKTLQTVADLLSQDDHWLEARQQELFSKVFGELQTIGEYSQREVESSYTALFTVKPAAPPYESYYLDEEGFSRGWIAARLIEEYTQAGLDLSESFKEPPDHVAVELEFLSYLCWLESEAQAENDNSRRTLLRQRQHSFLDSHLGIWFPQFAARVRATEALPVYRSLVDAAQVLIQDHHKRGSSLPRNRPAQV